MEELSTTQILIGILEYWKIYPPCFLPKSYLSISYKKKDFRIPASYKPPFWPYFGTKKAPKRTEIHRFFLSKASKDKIVLLEPKLFQVLKTPENDAEFHCSGLTRKKIVV